jgi:hypothetical protein
MGEFMKLKLFIAIGSSGDFGVEMVWFNVASKWDAMKNRSHSRRVRASVRLFALTDREHCSGGKFCLVSFQWPFVLRFDCKIETKSTRRKFRGAYTEGTLTLWPPRIFRKNAVINYSFRSLKFILCLSYWQRPTVGQADSGPYPGQGLAEPELNNTYSSTSMSPIRLRRNTISCILLFKTYFYISESYRDILRGKNYN